jgi:thiol-disulfide isomerase/thioredoxin
VTWALIGVAAAGPIHSGSSEKKGDKNKVDPVELEARLAALEQTVAEKVKLLETQVAQLKQQLEARPAAAVAPVEDPAAAGLRSEAEQFVAQANFAEAKAKLDELYAKYPQSSAARSAQTMRREVEVVGREVPQQLDVEKWYQGEQEALASAGTKATLLVFWETWCPHCQREVPRLTALYERFKAQGLRVIGLTKVSKSASDEAVAQFIKERSVAYPIAKERGGSLSTLFNVSGVPAAAVVKDGKVVWRGHPARLSDQLLQSWL